MTILIVGASGFLGTELVRQAVLAGHTTAGTYASRPGSAPEATWHALDLRDADNIEAVVAETRLTDDVRCPVHVSDLAAALLGLATADTTGIQHLGGAEAVSRYVPCQVHLFRFCGVL